MIVLEDKQTVILTPPGTSAEIVHSAICQRKQAYWVLGTNSQYWVDEATNRIPDRWLEYKRVIVVRNPFTRAIELFDHYNREREKTIKANPHSFAEFIGNIAGLPWFYSETIDAWAGLNDTENVVRYESLAKDLKKELGISVKLDLPKLGDWRKYWYKIGADLMLYFRIYSIHDSMKYGYLNRIITEAEARLMGVK